MNDDKGNCDMRSFALDPAREVEHVDRLTFRELEGGDAKTSAERTAMQRNGSHAGLLYSDRAPTPDDFAAVSILIDSP